MDIFNKVARNGSLIFVQVEEEGEDLKYVDESYEKILGKLLK